MPLFDYKCPACGKKFTELVKNYDDVVTCPDCGKTAEKDYNGEVYGATGKKTNNCSGNCKNCSGCR